MKVRLINNYCFYRRTLSLFNSSLWDLTSAMNNESPSDSKLKLSLKSESRACSQLDNEDRDGDDTPQHVPQTPPFTISQISEEEKGD